ncbi:sulfite exporter TauE/SafE family protein [Adlercreutzia mucosicola]|uniref:sulfite exporter TauE/SafE family protein n=1 Tax=Adlercreutzia mucosicola TaxID=580026 RepID=UPI0012EBFD98|nr:sulfite exporter TauE/SafE family protein [Adlercreutzia mucosicola]MCR2036335.1 sulfite exporter TauE/SafE family protein [Adlercreutzia mucosicola]
MAAVSLVVGLAVGVLAGLLGVGGGTLLVPIFKLGYAMDSIMCTATSLFTIIPTSVSGALSHLRNKTCIPRLGLAAGLGGAVTSPLGVWLATQSPDWAIMGAAALIIVYSATTMFRKALAAPKVPWRKKHFAAQSAGEQAGAVGDAVAAAAASVPSDAGAPSASAAAEPASPAPARPLAPSLAAEKDAATVGPRELAIGVAIGLVAGLASGYVGVGGGFIMVPMMISIAHISMRVTSGTSLIAVMILAVPGTIAQALLGNINWIAGIAVACGSIPGAALGARLVPRVPERQLRFLFAGFLVVAALMLVVNQLGLWG